MSPNESAASDHLGDAFAAQGDMARAADAYQQALFLQPGNAAVHFKLGNALRLLGRLDEAITCYRQAIGLRPDDAGAHNNLGLLLDALGQKDQAVACLREALRWQPHSAERHNNLGAILDELGRSDEAYACFREALRLKPDYQDAHFNLGNALRVQGRLEEAVACYRRAIQLRPDNASAIHNLGAALGSLQRLEEAAACYQEVIRLAPDHVEAYKNAGAIFLKLKRPGDAARCLRQALALAPADQSARHMLAALTGEVQSRTAPREYVAGLFDGYADNFDEELVTSLRYRGPELLRAALPDLVENRTLDILDLGCGTGLTGLAFRGTARTLTGVDLSARMLAKARARGIYDRLIHGDILEALEPAADVYDLIVAGDVFVYVGDLEAVFLATAKALRPGSRFAFLVEAGEATGFVLRASGRFAHALAYIRHTAAAAGFLELYCKKDVIRVESGEGIEGYVFVLQN